MTNDNDKLRELRAWLTGENQEHVSGVQWLPLFAPVSKRNQSDGTFTAQNTLRIVVTEIDRLLAEPAPPVQAPAGPLSHEAFLARRAMRLQFGKPLTFIEVHGPGRDYDFTAFCCDHNVQAEQCAAEWTAEVIDGLDAGQSATVNIYCDKTGRCNVCEPEDDDDGN